MKRFRFLLATPFFAVAAVLVWIGGLISGDDVYQKLEAAMGARSDSAVSR